MDDAKKARRMRRSRRLGRWIARLVKAAGFTYRYRLEDPHLVRNEIEEPIIFVVWHNRLLIALLCARRFLPKGHRIACLVSPSADGEILVAGLEALGHTAARGSSSRSGSRGLRELAAALERGDHAAVTPDGPRGPRYVLKPGVVQLARMTGYRLVPLLPEATRKIELRSWDRFQIPLPLARCTMTVGKPLRIGNDRGGGGGGGKEKEEEEAMKALASAMGAAEPE